MRTTQDGAGGGSGRGKRRYPSAVDATVRRYNKLDLELYDYAVELFDGRVEAMRTHKREGGVCGAHLPAIVVPDDDDSEDGNSAVCKLECSGGTGRREVHPGHNEL